MDPLPSGTADSNRRPEPQELPDMKHVTPLISDQSDPEDLHLHCFMQSESSGVSLKMNV